MPPTITDPSYISEQMFDKVVREKFQNNADDDAVRRQASAFLRMFQAGKTRDQIMVDILHASHVSRHQTSQRLAAIGFVTGIQFGFELALSFPPLPTQ